MSSALGPSPDVSATLQSVTEQLRWLQGMLLAEDTPDLRILTEFRDVVNRLRQTAWAVQQYGELIAAQTSSNPIATVLAGERIRAACQLCKLLEVDLDNQDIHIPSGQLRGLYDVVQELAQHLREHVEK